MDIFSLIAAFGGGVIGAYMGALPAFILTGVVALAGGVVALAGAPDIAVGFIAFGSYLGPHVAFAGGVAAAAYAGKKKSLKSGADLTKSLNGLDDPMVFVVGGVFGVIGFLICYFYTNILHFNTDLPGITVVTSALIARLAFGSCGILPKAPEGSQKEYFSKGGVMGCNIMLGVGIGIATSFTAMALLSAGVDSALVIANFPVLCFGIAATSLVFAQTGSATPATHHIALISATAAVLSGNPLIGVLFGVLAALFGDFIGKTFNSNCDTHIDPPAFTIFTFIFIINTVFGSGFFLT